MDHQQANEDQLSVLQDMVRWCRGEHPFVMTCARCKKLMVLCSVRALPSGAPNPNFGWWVAIDTPHTDDEMEPAYLHRAVVNGELHLLCRHGE